MLFLLKLFPEITIKSRPVRRRFIRQLRKNLRAVLNELDENVRVIGEWDSLEVESELTDEATAAQFLERLCDTPGIATVATVDKHPLPELDGMLELALQYHGDALAGKTFAVRCKRTGKHAFRSVDVERHVGAGLNQRTETAGVKLKDPDITVHLEVRHDSFFIVRGIHQGLGGYPLGCQDSVLSLISGGFDSSVSSYLCIRRGLQTHYCFFNLGGRAHELAVKEVALYLWMKFHSSHRVKFITVPFEDVVAEILAKVDNAQMGVVLKRMMLRAADKVAADLSVKALVTGESVAQVSSQTLANLSVIDAVSETLVLRPLAMSNKQDIIDIAREIGTEEFSRNIPEYCAVISDKPTTKARPERIEAAEANMDMAVMDAAIKNARHQLINEVAQDLGTESAEVQVVAEIADDAVVVDIRHPNEQELKPLNLPALGGERLLHIPFYQLRSDFDNLDRSRRYLLYCDKGMMSRLHAAHLLDEGFANIAVLDMR